MFSILLGLLQATSYYFVIDESTSQMSRLSVAQPCSSRDDKCYGDSQQTRLSPTHPCNNIGIRRVAAMLAMDWSEYEDGGMEEY